MGVTALKSWKAKFVFVVGILLMLGVAVQATGSNLHAGFALQAMVAAALMLYAALFDRLPKRAHIVAMAACIVPVCFVLFLGIYGNRHRTDYTEDVVIVLGAGLRGEAVGLHLANRLDMAVHYLAQNSEALVVVTGGLGSAALITEAEAMERYLVARGVVPGRIIQEDMSTSTYENLAFARDILEGHFPDGFRAALITNDFHIYRAVRTAGRIGIDVYGVGAPTPLRAIPVNYLREMLAVAHMWVFGQGIYSTERP